MLRELTQKQTGLEYLETVLRYVVSGTDKVSAETLKDVVEEVIVEGGSLMATIAEQWIEQGIEKGLERGLDAHRQTILQILQIRFTPTADQTTALSKQLGKIKTLTTLQALATQALHVFTLADFQSHLSRSIELENNDET